MGYPLWSSILNRPPERCELFPLLVIILLSLRMHLSARKVNCLVLVLYMTRPRGDYSYSMSMGTTPAR